MQPAIGLLKIMFSIFFFKQYNTYLIFQKSKGQTVHFLAWPLQSKLFCTFCTILQPISTKDLHGHNDQPRKVKLRFLTLIQFLAMIGVSD